ncbi:LPS export ABC transporter periplasmic protein LptC [Telmatospirillum sp.]|uniref:LPS export ABC transporter periplasmic protein LptC n=1 Tax=Telmatospirillum sp. TaxID=2079197 RepID=UPI00283FECCF|nr:LPS export ABC transporter periplasmic protein LptC [Telmatospirillum sp.]MDR3439542.1 LPS export ABC transporter periplasmic protein LptC [Telmatospirillum sp.]
MSQRALPGSQPLSRPRNLVGPAARLMQARYSRFVGLMKMALPAIAAALLGLVVVWPKVAPRDHAFQIAFANFNLKAVDTLSMTKPRYFGTDDKNLPFTVTADTATQVDAQTQAVALENPVADLTRKDGSGIVINSDVGFFRQKDGTLDLMGHVDLFQDSGYEMHTDSARIEVGAGNATGDDPTHGHGPTGTIEGEGFRLWERGKTIIFTGKSKAVLTMAKGKSK